MENLKPKEFWALLEDAPVNDNGEIEESFIHFPVGTDREDIWHYFEDEFNLSVIDFMNLGN